MCCLWCRRVQTALEEAQAEALHKAAACTSGGSAQLTVGKAMEASKEAAAQLAAKGLSHQPSSDSGDGPSRCHSAASCLQTLICEFLWQTACVRWCQHGRFDVQ